jgi:hypothetical protein
LSKSPTPHVTIRFFVPSTSLSWTANAKGELSSQITIGAADKSKHGVWNPSMLRVYTVSMPGGATPSAKVQAGVSFEMPYRDSNQLRFVVRDDASGHVGSTEIKVDPANMS